MRRRVLPRKSVTEPRQGTLHQIIASTGYRQERHEVQGKSAEYAEGTVDECETKEELLPDIEAVGKPPDPT